MAHRQGDWLRLRRPGRSDVELNETAAQIYWACSGTLTVFQIAGTLAAAVDARWPRVWWDVVRTVGALEQQGFVTVD